MGKAAPTKCPASNGCPFPEQQQISAQEELDSSRKHSTAWPNTLIFILEIMTGKTNPDILIKKFSGLGNVLCHTDQSSLFKHTGRHLPWIKIVLIQ
jgi:hypothetical protein